MKKKKVNKLKVLLLILLVISILGVAFISIKSFTGKETNTVNETIINKELDKLFTELGYNTKELEYISKLSDINIEKLKNTRYIDISDYYKYKNFNVDNYSRYVSYINANDISYEKAITYVNIGLDKEFYTTAKEVTDTDNILIIVNKYHYLDKDYVPKNLVTLFDSDRNAKMVDVAASSYKELIQNAREDGITLVSTTAYRSYSFQNTLYTNYVKEDGVQKADTYSARPGYSEHQTGLAVDLNDPNVSGKRLNEEDTLWLDNNAHKYGFIRRYKEEFIPITGYMNEEWHIRYVGVDVATIIHDENLTLEEYVDLYVNEY